MVVLTKVLGYRGSVWCGVPGLCSISYTAYFSKGLYDHCTILLLQPLPLPPTGLYIATTYHDDHHNSGIGTPPTVRSLLSRSDEVEGTTSHSQAGGARVVTTAERREMAEGATTSVLQLEEVNCNARRWLCTGHGL